MAVPMWRLIMPNGYLNGLRSALQSLSINEFCRRLFDDAAGNKLRDRFDING
jgi:hypothetical protein